MCDWNDAQWWQPDNCEITEIGIDNYGGIGRRCYVLSTAICDQNINRAHGAKRMFIALVWFSDRIKAFLNTQFCTFVSILTLGLTTLWLSFVMWNKSATAMMVIVMGTLWSTVQLRAIWALTWTADICSFPSPSAIFHTASSAAAGDVGRPSVLPTKQRQTNSVS